MGELVVTYTCYYPTYNSTALSPTRKVYWKEKKSDIIIEITLNIFVSIMMILTASNKNSNYSNQF